MGNRAESKGRAKSDQRARRPLQRFVVWLRNLQKRPEGYPVIKIGTGAVHIAPCVTNGGKGWPGLYLGRDGTGVVGEKQPDYGIDREARPGDTLAVLEFSSLAGLDVLIETLEEQRRNMRRMPEFRHEWPFIPVNRSA